MATPKKLGIWMDHAHAHLMEFSTESIATNIIESKFTHESKEETLGRSEHVMHNKEQHQQSEFYRGLGEKIRHYDEVILFGPTDAKTELLNVLKAYQRFAKIKIETKQADKMTENQQHAFVKEYFSKS